MKLMMLVSEAELDGLKAEGLDVLVDSLWLSGMSSAEITHWQSMAEHLVNEFACDVIVELPDADARSLSELADAICKWQPKLIPQFPINKDGLLTCKNFSSAGSKTAIAVSEMGQIAISLKALPTLLRLPISVTCGTTKGGFVELVQILSSVIQSIKHVREREHVPHIVLEVGSKEELNIATVVSPDGLLLPLCLFRDMVGGL
ncbi:MAG: hypothetical protein RMK18_04850 [Armatimonadota bacterium]|nr:hypothetical protein [Armatimonadota bacterium]MCX7777133.1 hypothetical protein [Armatimonadota bacterium]MDW8025180.1 hypothetical protein [Armatimonadota bacterium]